MKYVLLKTGPHDLRDPNGKQCSYSIGTVEASSPEAAFDIWFDDMNQKCGLNYNDINQTKSYITAIGDDGTTTIVYGEPNDNQ